MKSLIIFMYHGLERGAQYSGEVYTLSKTVFKRHLEFIAEMELEVTKLEEEPVVSKDKGIIFTFDDGEETVYSEAFPLMREFNYRGEVYITTDWIDKKGYLTKSQIMELLRDGWNIGSHGKTHSFLRVLSDSGLKKELSYSKKLLEDLTGKSVLGLSLPGGRGDKRVYEFASKEGYKYILSSIPGINNLPLVDKEIVILKRFPIKVTTSLKEFKLIIGDNKIYLTSLYLYYLSKEVAKKIIGDSLYHNIIKLISSRIIRRSS